MSEEFHTCMDCEREMPANAGTLTCDGCFVCDECSFAEMILEIA